jgi:sugar phosphate isomerase/epimerase
VDRQSDGASVHSGRRRQEIRADIEKWAEDYCLRLLDLCAELGVKIIPMFWGVAFGWELATGYPWGFWKGGDYDLLKEGQERFVKKTGKLRTHARKLGLYLAHEIHGGTGGDDGRRLQHARPDLRGDKVPGRECRSVPLLGRGGF